MPVLADYQFELNGLLFGKDTILDVDEWDVSYPEWRTQDQPTPNGDGMRMGRDYLSPPEWTFELKTRGGNLSGGLDALSQFTAAWRGGERGRAGVVSELGFGIAGRQRVVYGRPRRFAPSFPEGAAYLERGFTHALATFQLVDSLYYDAVSRSEQINMVTTSTGGWIWPTEWPITSQGSGQQQGTIGDVGGDSPTPLIITVYGPVTDIWVEGPDWRVDVDTALAYDQSLTIDARPWVNTVVRNDGVSLGGSLSRDSRLSRVRLEPGGAALRFGGSDPTNTAYAVFEWRPAYLSI